MALPRQTTTAASVHHLPGPRPIPGLTDISGLCDILLDRIPELAGECHSERDMEAVCDLEARTLLGLANARAANLDEIALKVCALIVRLGANTAEAEIPEGDAALLCSVLRDLVLLGRAAPRAAAAA